MNLFIHRASFIFRQVFFNNTIICSDLLDLCLKDKIRLFMLVYVMLCKLLKPPVVPKIYHCTSKRSMKYIISFIFILLHTLECLINVPGRLLILEKFSTQDALIRPRTLINLQDLSIRDVQ